MLKIVAAGAKDYEDIVKSGENWVRDLIKYNLLKPGAILDYGSGLGRISIPLTKMGFKVLAIDRREDMQQHLIENDVLTGPIQTLDSLADGNRVNAFINYPDGTKKENEFDRFGTAIAFYVFQHMGAERAREIIRKISLVADELLFTIPVADDPKRATIPETYLPNGEKSGDELFESCENSFYYTDRKAIESLLVGSEFKTLTYVQYLKNITIWRAEKN